MQQLLAVQFGKQEMIFGEMKPKGPSSCLEAEEMIE